MRAFSKAKINWGRVDFCILLVAEHRSPLKFEITLSKAGTFWALETSTCVLQFSWAEGNQPSWGLELIPCLNGASCGTRAPKFHFSCWAAGRSNSGKRIRGIIPLKNEDSRRLAAVWLWPSDQPCFRKARLQVRKAVFCRGPFQDTFLGLFPNKPTASRAVHIRPFAKEFSLL